MAASAAWGQTGTIIAPGQGAIPAPSSGESWLFNSTDFTLKVWDGTRWRGPGGGSYLFPTGIGTAGQCVKAAGTAGAPWTYGDCGSGGGGTPTNATYVTLSASTGLTDERILTGTANQITVTDGGAGGAVTLSLPSSVTIGSLTLSGAAGSGNRCLRVTNAGLVQITGSDCGAGGGVAGVSTFNTQTGDITLVGTANKVSVSTVGTTVTLSLPATIDLVTGLTTAGQTAIQIKPWGTVAGQLGEIRFLELVANGTEYTGFKGRGSVAASFLWQLPDNPGVNGQCLGTDGGTPVAQIVYVACGGGGGGGGITNLNGLVAGVQSFINDTNIGIVSAGSNHTITFTGPWPVSRGGTGLTSGTAQRIPYFSGTTTLATNSGLRFDDSVGKVTVSGTGIPFEGIRTDASTSGVVAITNFRRVTTGSISNTYGLFMPLQITNSSGQQWNSISLLGQYVSGTGTTSNNRGCIRTTIAGTEDERICVEIDKMIVLKGSMRIDGPIPWADIRSFGGNFQTAHDSLPSTGGAIYCPPGLWLTPPVSITKPVLIFGLGGGESCVIQSSGTDNIFEVSLTNAGVGGSSNNYTAGPRVTFRDVMMIPGSAGYAVTVDAPNPGISCSSITFDAVQTQNGLGGINMISGCGFYMTNSKIAEYTSIGLQAASRVTDGGLFHITNSQICSVKSGAYPIKWISGSEFHLSNSELCTATGLYIFNMDWNNPGFSAGGSYLNITGTTMESGGSVAAIRLKNVVGLYNGINLTGNNITSTTGDALRIEAGGTRHFAGVVITGNLLRGGSPSVPTAHCMSLSDIDGLIVTGNICEGPGANGIAFANNINQVMANNVIK